MTNMTNTDQGWTSKKTKPPKKNKPPMSTKKAVLWLCLLSFLFGLKLSIDSGSDWSGNLNGLYTPKQAAALIFMFLPMVVLGLWGLVVVIRTFWRESGIALSPPPSPQQIYADITAQFGRKPTDDEFSKLYPIYLQAHNQRRNQAWLVTAAIAAVGWDLNRRFK